MPSTRLISSVAITASLLLQGCATAPPVERTVIVPESVPELTLNLEEEKCNCVEQTIFDYTPLERGFTALAVGEHIEAVQHFQRYLRLEKTASAKLEANIAIAYVSTLPSSPFYNASEARKSYRQIRNIRVEELELHEQTLLMRQSLETFLVMERSIVKLRQNNATLSEDLEKREEALKRLRELALGQKGSRQ